MSLYRPIRPGDDLDAYCTRCKIDLTHTVLTLASENVPERMRCNTCGSEHRYLPERSSSSPKPLPATSSRREDEHPVTPPTSVVPESPDAVVDALRSLLSEAGMLTPTRIGTKWEGGTLVLKAGRPGLQDKEIPIDTFFKKIVMVRDRLRVLEQQINANDKLSDAEKISLQQYITRCYGSLTTFNALFDARDDWFVGEKKSE